MASGRVTARQVWVAMESVHAVTYFARRCRRAMRDAGLKGFWNGYFAARAAPLGAVGAGPLVAAFFNFDPAMVHRAVPSCWDVVDPARLTVRRAAAVAGALGELCGPDTIDAALAALPALRAASARCGPDGRLMGAANARLWVNVEPELRCRGLHGRDVEAAEVWQACTTLREHRGDGHVAALLAHGLNGLQAHLLAVGTQGVAPEVLRDNRGWTAGQWDGALDRLAARGLLRADGTATEARHRLHRDVESMTDDLAESAFAPLRDEELAHLYESLLSCARQIQASGCLPFPNPMGLPML